MRSWRDSPGRYMATAASAVRSSGARPDFSQRPAALGIANDHPDWNGPSHFPYFHSRLCDIRHNSPDRQPRTVNTPGKTHSCPARLAPQPIGSDPPHARQNAQRRRRAQHSHDRPTRLRQNHACQAHSHHPRRRSLSKKPSKPPRFTASPESSINAPAWSEPAPIARRTTPSQTPA
jgi:hypothetical protein